MNPPGPTPISRWFTRRFGQPTPVQSAAWPEIQAGKHTLIVAPTGSGKTFAAFHVILDQLAGEHARGALGPGIQAVYISPLRALSYDLEKNLAGPLAEAYPDGAPIQVGLRSGDTPPEERKRQWTDPPHLLLTTPESLTLLLSQARWVGPLSRVRWVIVDETHALAENKRGALLALALERLEAIARHGAPGGRLEASTDGPRPAPQRIGLSATIHPLGEAAGFIAGPGRPCAIVDVSGAKRIELSLYTPLRRDPYPMAGFTGERLIGELARLIQSHRTTLVFTNTRSGAESAAYWLREGVPALAGQIECHHASLERELRLQVEDRLKRGELRCVVCSTSLELGIDIGSIDLVVMLAAPKGVTKALQRTGRAGHNLREVSRGLLMATNVNDLIESAATARLARRRSLESLRASRAPLDVLAQHLMSLGCHGEIRFDAAFELARQSWPYRNLERRDFDDTVDYLAGGGASLRSQYADVFGKIVVDPERGVFEARAGPPRRDFLENVGAIPNDDAVQVIQQGRPIGSVEESFLNRLRAGDVFLLAGRPVRLDRVETMAASVSPAPGATPTVPRWGANKMPLSNRVADEIADFRSELRRRMQEIPFAKSPSLIPWVAERLEIDRPNAAIVFRVHAAQHHLSEIPTADFLLVESLREAPPAPASPAAAPRRSARRAPHQLTLDGILSRPPPAPALPASDQASRHYFFHCLIGRAANDALSRVVALRLSRLRGGNAVATPDDYGFVLSVAESQRLDPADLAALLSPEGFVGELEQSLAQSALLKYHFRNAAQTGLMVYRNYFGQRKAARKMQWSAEVIFNVLAQHEPDHVLMREARREALHTFLDAGAAAAFLERARSLPLRLREVAHVPPLCFAMYATRIKEALVVEDPRETLERLYHEWWQRLNPGGLPAE